ncbi:NAD(P)-dependent dehydrogenase (short-subunit alcohol dehydrogenase family) [Rhodobium orientis]|uniref:3-oxoacyl-ACP reductase n=1 Tax=Rhodobium orientis TaxID=34017 RepID=A0A327JSF8_9HYPH|nr:SDR family oxidoreductase [Rhodobium orientis]MBB4303463.1 NAD(P)-dependent dehydrogenase (short-subunit alcohol dehydrogenase family) [Rhodobium orientis]MBK5950397.1 3-oxoacyl-ACP reductase [Rhodobium orientis]RAI28373.1 3-oxoacyl-ACP reductase [Rhodobium orientis]
MPDYARYPSLEDRVVFITGGAAGIGGDMVRQFAGQGAKVGFIDLAEEAGRETVAACIAAGAAHAPLFIAGDLRDIDALKAAIAETGRHFGDITVLVNNAANDDRHDWSEVTPEYWDDRFAVNLRHQFFAIQAVVPQMRRAGFGSIVNIGSSCWMIKEDFFPGYAIAKSAVQGLTHTMARTFGPDNIRVNAVLPGWVATERQLQKWWSPEGEAGTMEMQCLKRRITAEEFNQMVLFLAADDGGACTAQSFVVDGGRGPL